ncbi:hypothetical protein AJ80_05825 [Polytolypa hystricis UAMH7299]|uniref:F-box domain-containing protein n=1 Tax=Polytolypa hystricis (strain UAMH7299) TaxID=1447883 RepID=A0A2B7Y0C9_POLH7|nr:hypothetical protein AJ80_05825 [Polytolypa hystricis UAMH7299]
MPSFLTLHSLFCSLKQRMGNTLHPSSSSPQAIPKHPLLSRKKPPTNRAPPPPPPSSQRPSLLLSLPREIRDIILLYVLTARLPLPTSFDRHNSEAWQVGISSWAESAILYPRTNNHKPTYPTSTPLLLTNRQLRAETLDALARHVDCRSYELDLVLERKTWIFASWVYIPALWRSHETARGIMTMSKQQQARKQQDAPKEVVENFMTAPVVRTTFRLRWMPVCEEESMRWNALDPLYARGNFGPGVSAHALVRLLGRFAEFGPAGYLDDDEDCDSGNGNGNNSSGESGFAPAKKKKTLVPRRMAIQQLDLTIRGERELPAGATEVVPEAQVALQFLMNNNSDLRSEKTRVAIGADCTTYLLPSSPFTAARLKSDIRLMLSRGNVMEWSTTLFGRVGCVRLFCENELCEEWDLADELVKLVGKGKRYWGREEVEGQFGGWCEEVVRVRREFGLKIPQLPVR